MPPSPFRSRFVQLNQEHLPRRFVHAHETSRLSKAQQIFIPHLWVVVPGGRRDRFPRRERSGTWALRRCLPELQFVDYIDQRVPCASWVVGLEPLFAEFEHGLFAARPCHVSKRA